MYVCYDELDNSTFKDIYGRISNGIKLKCALYNKVDQYLENLHSPENSSHVQIMHEKEIQSARSMNTNTIEYETFTEMF